MRSPWVLAAWVPVQSSCLFSGPCWTLPGHGARVGSPEGLCFKMLVVISHGSPPPPPPCIHAYVLWVEPSEIVIAQALVTNTSRQRDKAYW